MPPVRLFLAVVLSFLPHPAAAQTIPDRLRDCALSVRVALPIDGTEQPPQVRGEAQARVSRFQVEMSREEFEECLLLSTVGFEHGFVPMTYALGAGRSIELSLRGATLWSEGQSSHFQWGIMVPGIRFLASRHTVIPGDPPQTMRHFIELFVWVPRNVQRDVWDLRWHPFEVGGSELIPIGVEPLLTITAAAPPAAADFDVHAIASIQRNDAGRVEWRIQRGAAPQQGFIPSPAERRAHEDEGQRQKDALEKVNWNRARDVRRAPALTYADSNGCGNVEAFGWSEDHMEAIRVLADAELLRLSATPQIFDIARQPSALTVTVHVYARPLRSFPFCTDLVVPTTDNTPPEEWRAIGGQVSIDLVPTITISGEQRPRATIRVSGAVFVNAQGIRVTQVQPIVLTAIVGWVAG